MQVAAWFSIMDVRSITGHLIETGGKVGKNLFVILLGSFLFLIVIDFFTAWYRKYLARNNLPHHVVRTIIQLKWVVLAFLFWNALYRYFLPEEFTYSYLLFALFVYSLRGLAAEIFRRDK